METITLPEFGPATHLTAAEVVAPNGDVYAAIREPEARGEASFNEDAFRTAVREAVCEWDMQGVTLTIQFDPGRDLVTEETIEL